MTETAERLKNQLSNLSPHDRAELAQFLLQSLDSDEGWNEETEKLWDVELERRMNEIKSGQASGEPFEKILQELRDQYS